MEPKVLKEYSQTGKSSVQRGKKAQGVSPCWAASCLSSGSDFFDWSRFPRFLPRRVSLGQASKSQGPARKVILRGIRIMTVLAWPFRGSEHDKGEGSGRESMELPDTVCLFVSLLNV